MLLETAANVKIILKNKSKSMTGSTAMLFDLSYLLFYCSFEIMVGAFHSY